MARAGLGRLFSWSLLGQGLLAASQWSLLVLLAKVGAPEQATARLGAFVLALALTSPFNMLGLMELRALVAADFVGRVPVRTYAGARTLGMVVLAVGAPLFAWVFDGEAHTVAVVALLCLARWFEGGLDLVHGLYQRAERQDLVARSQGSRAVLGAGGFAAGLFAFDSLTAALAGLALGWAIILIAIDLPTARRLDPPCPRLEKAAPTKEPEPSTGLGGLVLRALPLGLVGALAVLITNTPRYFIDAAEGKAALGVFGSVAYLLAVFGLINAALNAVLLPRFGQHLHDGNRGALRRLLSLAVLTAIAPRLLLGAIAWAVGDQLLTLLYRPGFGDYAHVLVALAIADAIGGASGMLRSLLTAANRLRAQVPIQLGALAIAAAISSAMVWAPHAAWTLPSPAIVAAVALGSSRAVTLVAHALLCWRLLRTLGPPNAKN